VKSGDGKMIRPSVAMPHAGRPLEFGMVRPQPDDALSAWGTARKMLDLYGEEAFAVAVQRRKQALSNGTKQSFYRWANIAAHIARHLTRRRSTLPPANGKPAIGKTS
jgi:hypothetical protein